MNIRLNELQEGGGSTSRNVDEIPSAMAVLDGSTVTLRTYDIDVTFEARLGRWAQVHPAGEWFVRAEHTWTVVEAPTAEAAAIEACDSVRFNSNQVDVSVHPLGPEQQITVRRSVEVVS